MHISLMSKMKSLIKFFMVVIVAMTCTNIANAQSNGGFDPARFKAELERFVTAEAHLSQTEAIKFFPLYHEMCQKQRTLYTRIGELRRNRPTTDDKCKAVILEIDRLTIEIDELQVTYHNKFLTILKPGKLFDVIQSISRFHRKAMREAGARR